MESLTPLVSILLPVKQWRDTTNEAVTSLLSQTVSSFEILLIGNEDVQQILPKLPDDKRIKGIARQGSGIVAALNTGLAAATGTYIARMDDDDVAYPKRLEAQLDYLQTNPEVQLCASKIRFIDSTGGTENVQLGNRRYANWLNTLTGNEAIRTSCYTECPMPHPTWLAHRNVWQRVNGYREFDGPEDYDFILRALIGGIVMGKPDEVLQDWREHAERLTYTDPRYRRLAFTQCRAWAATQINSGLNLHTGRKVWLCGTGKNARDWYDALLDRHVEVSGFVDIKPTHASRLKRGKPIISYEDLPQCRENALVITALSEPAARTQLQTYFDQQQWIAGKDYIFGS